MAGMLLSTALTLATLMASPRRSPAATAEDFQPRVFASATAGLPLPYRLFLPRGYDPKKTYPLILFLHGAGERGNDNLRQLGHGVLPLADATIMGNHPAIVVAPQCPEGAQWVETPPGPRLVLRSPACQSASPWPRRWSW